MNKENECNIPNKRQRVQVEEDSDQTNSHNDDSDYWPDFDNELGTFYTQIPLELSLRVPIVMVSLFFTESPSSMLPSLNDTSPLSPIKAEIHPASRRCRENSG